MDEFELKRIIYDYVKEICHYSQMQVFATSSYQRNYFQLQIDDTINGLINLLLERDEMVMQQNSLASQVEWMQQRDQEIQAFEAETPRIITLEELKEADGSEGKKAYVAVNGYVYDVSAASRWGGGTHFGLYAGRDHTSEFIACHNSMYEILKILPVIGVLQK